MEKGLYRNILIATDGSESSRFAADSGIKLARLSGAKIQAVYVINIYAYSSIPRDPVWSESMYTQFKELGRDAVSYIENMAKDEGVNVETRILEGYPAEEILNFAEEQDSDLIVLGSLGKTAIERFLIGSVSEKVVKNAKVSVLIVRPKSL